MSYIVNYLNSLSDRNAFWAEQARNIPWIKAPSSIYEEQDENHYAWFPDGITNMSYLCLDHQINEGRGQQIAIQYDSPVTQTKRAITYSELLAHVEKMAGALQNLGVNQGDTVIIYMPMVPEAVIAMLACARLGAIHSVVFGGFAPHELALRINDAKPKVLISASYGIEGSKRINYKPLVKKAIEEATNRPEHCVYFMREGHQDTINGVDEHDFYALIKTATPSSYTPVPSTHPLYILYTSGTTGAPKGIVRDTGAYATALKFSMKSIYNTKEGDVFWAASDVGWVVGHSYMVYGPLLHGCTSILYEGKPVGTPDASAFWRIIDEYGVNVLFTAPTAIRAIRKEDPQGDFIRKASLSSLSAVFLAGERCDPATLTWLQQAIKRPVIDHWWQTESGWPMLSVPLNTPDAYTVKPGSAGLPVCGFDIQIIDEEGVMKQHHGEGLVVVKLPLPPGCLIGLWQNDERFVREYLTPYKGFYLTGDGGYFDQDGYCFIMGRVDDVINVSGHRLSTGEMEEWVATHPAVAECAVVGINDALRGQRPVALVVLKDQLQDMDAQAIETEIIALIREKIGAIAYLKNVYIVNRLPKTRSGKILRKSIRSIIDGIPHTIPSTIDDPSTLDEISLLFTNSKKN